MECEGEIISGVVRQYNPSSGSVSICCFDSMVVAIAPVHNAGWITQRAKWHTQLHKIWNFRFVKALQNVANFYNWNHCFNFWLYKTVTVTAVGVSLSVYLSVTRHVLCLNGYIAVQLFHYLKHNQLFILHSILMFWYVILQLYYIYYIYLHCVQKKTHTHIFFHISMNDEWI